MKVISVRVQGTSEFQLFQDFEEKLQEKFEKQGFFVNWLQTSRNLDFPEVSFEIENQEKKVFKIQNHPIPYENNGNFGWGRTPLHFLGLVINIQ
jgi:hypothetical protein